MVNPKNHRSSPKKCVCGAPSLKGLSESMCAYAWDKVIWGEEWANELYPDHPHRQWEVTPKVAAPEKASGVLDNLRVKTEKRYLLRYLRSNNRE